MSTIVRRRLVARVGPCAGCGACLLTCPERAIRPVPGDPAGATLAATPATLAVLSGRCTGCGECVEICPVDAITLEDLP